MTAHRRAILTLTLLAATLVAGSAGVQPAAAAKTPDLRAGVGRADITPRLGYIPLGGRVAPGPHRQTGSTRA